MGSPSEVMDLCLYPYIIALCFKDGSSVYQPQASDPGSFSIMHRCLIAPGDTEREMGTSSEVHEGHKLIQVLLVGGMS